ncbi:TRAP transporter substrate-binding protein DctP [uncultured Albimonas sp.]|uniref:TRAP transporter substrate-binding protein DctP n=1 Tax=uncultured Albimonas sp. TaxID=1331701 RepID=UPI0030EC4247
MTKLFAKSAAAACLALTAAPALAGEVVYSSFLPSTHPDVEVVMGGFARDLSERSGGAQSISITAGGALASAASTLDAIVKGSVDAGGIVYNYSPSLAPAVALVGDMPGKIQQVAAAAAAETLLVDCAECREEMERVGFQVVLNQSTEPFSLICHGRSVASLDDFRGLKVRATGALARMVQNLGGTPVNITFAEVYEGLQRGQVDCTASGAASLRGMQFWDVTDTVTTDFPMGTVHGYGLLTINGELWADLSAEDKRLWLDLGAEYLARGARQTLSDSSEAMRIALADKGMEAVPADAELRAALDAAFSAQVQAAMASAAERGVKDPQAIADAWFANVEKWTAIYEEIGGDGEWTDAQWAEYAARAKAEIYDKVPLD